MGVYRSSVPDYVVVGTVVLGRRHWSGSRWEFVSDFFLVPSVLLLFILLLIVNYAIFVLFIGLVLSFLLLP